MRVRGSFTVEAAMVMGVVFFALFTVIRVGYQEAVVLADVFQVSDAVARLGYVQEGGAGQGAIEWSGKNGKLTAKRELLGVRGRVENDMLELEIEKARFAPEEWIRMSVLLEGLFGGEETDESDVSQGD
ncbi:MAG: hypothetical protein LBR77_00975 [Lachnospiraceae bacterium]|jgi:hypothetical protein|nr:hypothetical protein [Lachnospiraceae bacterium]